MVIKLTNITKKFDNKTVLNHFSHDIKIGETTCIMGASGSGKTTLLRIMMGLETPDDGLVEGVEQLRKSVVFQEDRLCENLTVATNIKMARQELLEQAHLLEAVQKMGLPADCLKQAVQTLSGGQKRRVAILRALLTDYDMLLMDEPFKGLDVETKGQVIDFVKESTVGKTVILVTHDETECEAMADVVIAT